MGSSCRRLTLRGALRPTATGRGRSGAPSGHHVQLQLALGDGATAADHCHVRRTVQQ
ncbi:MAG TPA: hypothetical protein VFW03_13170 [Gemmatimonadaceae bacterium]|nr:hypothetical protein [Gemmatimonadaceae bacterium]